MRAADRTEDLDQDIEAANRSRRVGEQRHRSVPARKPLGHDAGTDDDGQQQGGPQRFGKEPIPQIGHGHQLTEMRSRWVCSSALLSVSSGSISSCSMRYPIAWRVNSKAWRLLSSPPGALDGSA